MRRTTIALLLATATAMVTVPALAADPESGAISAAAPKAEWTGHIEGSSFAYLLYTTAGQDPAATCEDVAPSCDTFALKVSDGPANVKFAAVSENINEINIVIEKPDGSTVVYTGDDSAKGTFKNMPSGDYLVHVYGVKGASSGSVAFDYAASAIRQGEPPAEPAPAAPPAPAPEPPAAAPPAAQGPAKLTVKPRRYSARKLRRALVVDLQASRRVTNLVATLKKGRRTVGRARVAGFEGSGSLRLRLPKRLKAGRYRLALRADDGVRAARTITVRR